MRNLYQLVLLLLCGTLPLASLQAACGISISNTSPCAGETVFFDSGTGSNYTWDFDNDGSIDATGNTVGFTFPASTLDKNYLIQLYQNGTLCDVENLFVAGLPDPSIDVVPNNAILEDSLIRVCSALPQATLQIFNASTTLPNNTGYTISWGDGSVENFDNSTFPNSSFVSHNYAAYGYYDIVVTATRDNGCTATKNYLFYNGSNPSVGLANPGNTVGLCAPATIDFPITNTGNNPAGTDYFIYIGGELIETYDQSNVPAVYTYTFLESSCGLQTTTGNYQNAFDVQVVASNPCGSSQATIEPIEVSTPPEPEFLSDLPTLVCQDDIITITNNSANVNEVFSGNPSICESSLSASWVISPGVQGIDWNLISGNIFSSNQIQVVFQTAGDYTITMSITSPSCGTFTFSETYTILNSPVAGSNLDLQSAATPSLPDECIPTAAIFTNESTGDSLSYYWQVSPNNGWNFATGFGPTSENLELVFTTPGSYYIKLTTSNPCRDVAWDTTIIIADIPLVSLDPIPDFCESATLDFTPSNLEISQNGGSISSYHWEFPGGTPASSTAAFPQGISYDSHGEYVVWLTVENQCGPQIISDTFTIQEPGALDLSPDQSFCQEDSGFQLSASPGGGNWTGNGVSPSGWFTPSANNVGTNVLNYSFLDGGCDLEGTVTVTVFPTPPVSAGESQAVCENDEPILITGGSPLGGTWTSDNGGVITATNAFDPVASGVGVYTLTYDYTDANGCSDVATKTIVVHELPAVEAGPDQTLCDTPNEIQLTGFNPAGGTWTGPGVSPAGLFQSINGPGDYALYYTYSNPTTSCTNIDSLVLTVIAPEGIDAGPNDSLCIEDGVFALQGFSPANGTWSGPGIIDSINGLFDPMLSGGGYHELVYRYGTGTCLVEDRKIVIVVDLTNVILSPSQSVCLYDEPYRLIADGPDGGVWSGPGIVDADLGIFDPAAAGPGVHDVQYRYDHPSISCSASASTTVTVFDVDPAAFEIPTVACEFTTLELINHSNPAYSNYWDFGDGQTSIEATPIHLFEAPGTYDIQLIVTSPQGCVDTLVQQLLITESPEPVFSLDNTEGCAPFDVNFTNQSSGFDVDFNWDFGNGQSSTEVHPDPITYFPGINDTTYIVTLTVTNLCGDRAYNAVVKAKASPQADFGLSPQNLCSPLEVAFANISTGSASNFFWDFGNGQTSTDSFPSNQIYVSDSLTTDYTVMMIAANSCGLDTAFQNLTVQPADVQAFFNTSDRVGCQPFTVEFYNFASPGANVDWDFGDGNSSDQLEPIHTFTEPGSYHVVQYASNLCGFDSVSVQIIVLPSPEIEFSHNSFVCLGEEISFANESTNISGSYWDFGDGNTSALTSPTHVYQEAGVFQVTLTGTSLFNQCPGTETSEVIVQPLPLAAFEPAEPYGCAPFTTTFLNQSEQGAFYVWDFGDGTTSVEKDPQHTFTDPGTYEVQLVVTDAFSCSNDTTILNILVNPHPDAAFEFDQQLLCRLPVAINFENSSEGADAYFWDFGDDSRSVEKDPVHFYNIAGTFAISLVAVNQFNCSDTFYQSITTHPEPIADFTTVNHEGCGPLEVRFENHSKNVTTYLWDFGGQGNSTEQNPLKVFDTAGTYDITLIAGIDDICFDTLLLESSVEVFPQALADFEIVAANSNMDTGEFELRNRSKNADLFFWDFGDGTTSEAANPIHRYTSNGVRQIYLEANNEFGCVDDTLLYLTPPLFGGLFIPSGFSPEQGLGDVRVFKPAGTGLKEYHIQVFSPYGQLLWESTELEEGHPAEAWDGTHNGKLLPQDVYVWKAYGVFENGQVWSGQEDAKGKMMQMGSVILLR